MSSKGHFMYFAYGSNLLKERLQLKNPSAEFHCVGRLKEHSERLWHGGVANIEESTGGNVWGVVWRMNNDNLASLDKQEGVHKGLYRPLEVTVETNEGNLLCRTYQMNSFSPEPASPQYKQVVCLGARQNGLPSQYLERLEALETNSYNGPSILDGIKQTMAKNQGESVRL